MEDKESNHSFLRPGLEEGDTESGSKIPDHSHKNGNGVVHDVTQSDSPIGPCGFGPFRPLVLQKCKTVSCFTAVYSFSGIMTSALVVYISSQITTLEKHFNLSSSVSGIIMSCNDLGYFLTVLLLSHLARHLHIPRFLAISTFVYGISGLVCTIPYFGTRDTLLNNQHAYTEQPLNVSTIRTSSSSQMALCFNNSVTAYNHVDSNVTSCDDTAHDTKAGGIHGISDHWRSLAVFIIMVSMVIQGMAKSPRQAFVGVYIDDNGPKRKSSMYFGFIVGMAIFGPALAYLIGGMFSSIYITLEDTELSPRDPRWLGAWWLGFLLFGVAALISGIPILCFPRKLRVKAEIEKAQRERIVEAKGNNKLLFETKGFFKSVFKLLRTPIFILVVLGNSLNMMGISGFLAFKPKYLEVHFSVPTWKANIVIGATTIVGGVVGSILGGIIVAKRKLSPLACLKTTLAALTVSLFLACLGFVIVCDQPALSYGKQGVGNETGVCSAHCGCNPKTYFPVCGADGVNYFSPCYAGCTGTVHGGRVFSNCSCLLDAPATSQTATGGLCDTGRCGHNFWVYTTMAFLFSLIGTLVISPSFIVTIRSVEESLKPMAIGAGSFITTLIGWFPGPIIFGMVIDTSCLVTQASSCSSDGKGACLLYDLVSFRNQYHGLLVGLRISSLILFSVALAYACLSSKPVFQANKDYDNDDVNNHDENGRAGEGRANNILKLTQSPK